MNNKFYCVGCGKWIESNNAGRVFKTGFFRNKYSLGCCEACLKLEASATSSECEEEKKQCALYIHPAVEGYSTVHHDSLRHAALV